MSGKKGLSRRDFFKRFLGEGIIKREDDEFDPVTSDEPIVDHKAEDLVAVIQAKYCLAYEEIPCTDCHDHCPEPNVIVLEDGLPRINVDGCTGCRRCQDVCPSAAEAILMVKRFSGGTGGSVW